jgi:hypothetical protein
MTRSETAPDSPDEPAKSAAENETHESSEPQPQTEPPEFRSPIVGERQVGRFEFLYRRLPVSARMARVLVSSSGQCVEYRPDRQPTTGELLWGGTRMVYDVDLGVHVARIEAAPPSRGDKVAFRATIDLIWQVTDASKVVLAGIDDVRQAVSPSLLYHLRSVTREHDIDASEDAEAAANKALDNESLGAEFGLSLQVFVRLTMDEPSLEHAAIRRRVDLFRTIIAAGDYDQFALQLALKPDDIETVVKLLVGERDSHRQAVFDFVTRLLESDALDRWQIDDQVRTTLQWLRDSGFKVLAGTDGTRAVSFGENYRKPPDGSTPP